MSQKMPEHRWTYPCVVTRVVDGDTVDVLLDKGYKEYKQVRVRLFGIDTPERGEPGYWDAYDGVYDWVDGQDAFVGWPVKFPLLYESLDDDVDSFGRYLGRIWAPKIEDHLSRFMLAVKLAKEYVD